MFSIGSVIGEHLTTMSLGHFQMFFEALIYSKHSLKFKKNILLESFPAGGHRKCALPNYNFHDGFDLKVLVCL
jgi:hypothetical protein